MSNIDKLKSAAAKAVDNFDPNMFVETRDVLALLDELEAKDRRIEDEIGRANREHHRGFMMACGHLEEHSNPHYADAAEMEIAALRKRINELESAKPSPISMKDHQIRELVNELRDIAVDYHGTQQLRERIARTIRAAMLQGAEPVTTAYKLPEGWVAVPVEPTEDMIVNGFESEPDESFSDEKEWESYEAMSGCQQAAHRATLCWAAMLSAAPKI